MSLDIWQGAEQEFAASGDPVGLFSALDQKGVFIFKPDDNIPRGFLQNSGQCYIHSNLFEVCTPECRNPLELVAYDKACEAYARLASWSYEEKTGEVVHLYKTNIAHDPKGLVSYTTMGAHENYQVKRKSYLANLDVLVPYLVLRQVFCGAGGYIDGSYMVSPRAIFPKTIFSEVSTDYPIVSTRDESHSSNEYCRAHIIHGEGVRSEYTMWLKHSITSYILSAIDQGYIQNVPEIIDPIAQGQTISKNPEGDWKINLTNGETIRVIDYLNTYYIEGIDALFDANDPSENDKKAFTEFKWVMKKLDNGLIENLNKSIEWVIKRDLIHDRFHDFFEIEEGLNEKAAKEAAMFQYTSITDPLFDELTESKDIKTVVTEVAIQQAFMKPPEESRGELRVALTKHYEDIIHSLSWAYIKVRPEIHYYPFEFNDLNGWTPSRINEKIKEIDEQLGR